MTPSRSLSMLALSALVAACGGGGEGGTAAAPAVSAGIPLAAAIAGIVNQNRTSALTISGTAVASGVTVNVSGSGTLTEATAAGSFEGTVGLRKSVAVNATIVASAGGSAQSAPLSAASQEYWDSNYKPVGATAAATHCVTTTYVPLPATAQAGSSGDWYTQECYTSSAKLSKLGTISASYALEAESADSALLRILNTSSVANGLSVPSTRTYRVTSAGAVTRLHDISAFSASGVTFNLMLTYQ